MVSLMEMVPEDVPVAAINDRLERFPVPWRSGSSLGKIVICNYEHRLHICDEESREVLAEGDGRRQDWL